MATANRRLYREDADLNSSKGNKRPPFISL
jgi:hypothetical protein